jgi:argininosuccinate synthase
LKKAIVGCMSAGDLDVIQRLSRDRDVIAVVFDLGEAIGMRELHDQARAAGASRCHVLDVRDEYIRACVLPAVQDGLVGDRARAFIGRKLFDIAKLEGGCRVIEPATPTGRSARRPHAAIDCSALVSIAFENRVPVAINDIPMTLSEIVDCLTTLGHVHGIVETQPAMGILQAANRQLEDRASGTARLELRAGNIRNSDPAFATT